MVPVVVPIPVVPVAVVPIVVRRPDDVVRAVADVDVVAEVRAVADVVAIFKVRAIGDIGTIVDVRTSPGVQAVVPSGGFADAGPFAAARRKGRPVGPEVLGATAEMPAC